AFAGNLEIGRAILVAECVAADDDRPRPAGHEARNILANNRLAEDHAAENVAERAVRRFPHLLQLELFHADIVRRDGGAFDASAALFDGIGGLYRDLIVRRVAVFDREIVIFEFYVEVGKNELVAYIMPDYPRHFVAIKFDNGIFNRDLLHRCCPWLLRNWRDGTVSSKGRIVRDQCQRLGAPSAAL